MLPLSRFPKPLHHGPFTVAEALETATSYAKLRHVDVVALSRGIKTLKNDDDVPLALLTRPYTLVTGYSAASHATAFAIWGFPGFLPGMNEPTIHISRQYPHTTVRRAGVRGHRTQFFDDEVTELNGLWITTRTRTWLDCARKMPVDELVVAADHLLRIPRQYFEARDKPYATVGDLAEMLDRHYGTPGIQKAKIALQLARVGSDSAPETRLRLAVVRAGLPEPNLNVSIPLNPGVQRTADQSFPEFKVAVEYDGGNHSDPEQVARDVAREEDYAASSWTQVRITKRHMDNDARAAVSKIRTALVARGWRPQL